MQHSAQVTVITLSINTKCRIFILLRRHSATVSKSQPAFYSMSTFIIVLFYYRDAETLNWIHQFIQKPSFLIKLRSDKFSKAWVKVREEFYHGRRKRISGKILLRLPCKGVRLWRSIYKVAQRALWDILSFLWLLKCCQWSCGLMFIAGRVAGRCKRGWLSRKRLLQMESILEKKYLMVRTKPKCSLQILSKFFSAKSRS